MVHGREVSSKIGNSKKKGIVQVTHLRRLPDIEGGGQPLTRHLCGHGRAGDLQPGPESLHHLLAAHAGWEAVASGADVRRDGAIGREEALGVPADLKRCMRRSR
jgi:hypothetical protein